MAQFDIFELKAGGQVVDCQADLLSEIGSRFVIPLVRPDDAPPLRPVLNPVFDVEGERLVMLTQLAAAIPTSQLGRRIASLSRDEYVIKNALDFLLTGV